MDIFFSDPDDVPQPPEEVKIRELEAKAYPDGRRVAIRFHITPFLQKPNIEIDIYNQDGKKVSSLSVVEAMENRMDFTMHLREPEPQGSYNVKMRLFYTNLDDFDLGERETVPAKTIADEVDTTIDTRETIFEVLPIEGE